MASYMRKCVSMGSSGITTPGSLQDIRSGNNGPMFMDTNTNWVRFVVDLSLFVTGGSQDAQGTWWLSWNQTMLNNLDAQIEAAKHTPVGVASGMSVILAFVNFPTWMNGTAGWDYRDVTHELQDRFQKGDVNYDDGKKEIHRFPDDLSTTSAWARVVWTICQRYNPNNPSRPSPNCWIDAIAPINEPNAAYFPQTGKNETDAWAPGPLVVGCKCAQMIATAAAMVNSLGGRPLVVVPGLIDLTAGSSRLQTNVYEATQSILSALGNANAPANSSLIWGQNTYGDVYHGIAQENRAAKVRGFLKGKWAGWPYGDANHPNLWGLEGGTNLLWADETRTGQASKLRTWWNGMNNDTDGAGAGVALFTQYLFNTDPTFDSGLREGQGWSPPGAPRPAYNDPWRLIRQDP